MIGNAMFGGRGGGEAPAAPAPGQVPAGGTPMASAACQYETRSFLECMTATNDNMDYCKSMFDSFKLCQANAAMQQQPQM